MTGGCAVKLAAGRSAPAPSQPRHRSHPNRSRSEPQALDVVKRDGTQATKTVQQTAVCDHRQGRSRSGKFVCSFHFACTMRICDGSNLAIFASCDPTFTRRCRRRAASAPPFYRLCAAVELSRMHQCTLGAFSRLVFTLRRRSRFSVSIRIGSALACPVALNWLSGLSHEH